MIQAMLTMATATHSIGYCSHVGDSTDATDPTPSERLHGALAGTMRGISTDKRDVQISTLRQRQHGKSERNFGDV